MNEKNFSEVIDIPFEYTTILAFSMLVRYQSQYSISINTLKEYRNELIAELKKVLERENDKKLINIKSIDEEEELINLLSNYSNIFKIESNDLNIESKIKLKELDNIIQTFRQSNYNDFVFRLSFKDRFKEILDLDTIKNNVKKQIKSEEELEKNYLFYGNGNIEYQSKIEELLTKRNIFYANILNNGVNSLEDYIAESLTIDESDVYQNSYPFDLKLYEKKLDSNDLEFEIFDLEDKLYDSFFYAIFDDLSLGKSRFLDDINNLEFYYTTMNYSKNQTEFSKLVNKHILTNARNLGSFVYTYIPDSEMLFYMTYIKKLDHLIENGEQNSEFLKIKNKLLFLLDNIGLKLFVKEKFEEHYNNRINLLNDCSFEDRTCEFNWYQTIAKYFIVDIFEGINNDSLLLKKITFISTYYELTCDEKIINLFNKYLDSPNYFKYYQLIFNETNKVKKK